MALCVWNKLQDPLFIGKVRYSIYSMLPFVRKAKNVSVFAYTCIQHLWEGTQETAKCCLGQGNWMIWKKGRNRDSLFSLYPIMAFEF